MAKLSIKDPTTLRFHYVETRALYEVALTLSAEAREVLFMLTMVVNMNRTVPPAANAKWWKAKLGISGQKWTRTLGELVSSRIVSIGSDTVSTTFSHVSCVKVANSDPISRDRSTGSHSSCSASSSACQETDSCSVETPSPTRTHARPEAPPPQPVRTQPRHRSSMASTFNPSTGEVDEEHDGIPNASEYVRHGDGSWSRVDHQPPEFVMADSSIPF